MFESTGAGAGSLTDDVPTTMKVKVSKISINNESKQFMIEKLG